MSFQVRVQVRGYELDTQGHLNQAVYLQYAEHARWEFLRAAGVGQAALIDSGIGPVALESTIRFHHELRGGDEIDVSCRYEFSGGKTFRMLQEFRRADGTLAADLVGVAGLMDLKERKLVAEPLDRLRALASDPDMFG
ncbi:MAG: acyl-CoA thioesterase [Micromonosporaceae bacterium]